jgi:hypothetical protein
LVVYCVPNNSISEGEEEDPALPAPSPSPNVLTLLRCMIRAHPFSDAEICRTYTRLCCESGQASAMRAVSVLLHAVKQMISVTSPETLSPQHSCLVQVRRFFGSGACLPPRSALCTLLKNPARSLGCRFASCQFPPLFSAATVQRDHRPRRPASPPKLTMSHTTWLRRATFWRWTP